MKFRTYNNILPSLSAGTIFIFFFLILGINMNAQDKIWNNKKCAVCLTYDDALNTHIDNVVPLLDSLGFKATFYVAGSFPGFVSRIDDWRKVAKEGHELGNHTLFHPCEGGGKPGREWVQPDADLSKGYTVTRMDNEIKMMNLMLYAVDGKKLRTLAYPCGDTKVGDSSYVPGIKNDFVGARSVAARLEKLGQINLFDIGSFMINNQSGDDLIKLAKQAMDNNALIVFLFHGVGGEHNINVSLEAHRKLLKFLKQNEKDIWVAPLVDIAEFVKEKQK